MITAVVVPALVAFGLSALLTFVCRAIALRTGVIALPSADRWNARPVALLGGPAIVAATALSLGLVDALPASVWLLLAGAIGISLVGLADDLRPIGPAAKLTAQLVLAAAVTGAGLRFPLTGIAVVDILVTMFWIVGLTNAFNLLDNMDGLSTGIAAIVGIVKLVMFAMEGEFVGAAAAGVFSGACLGFLVHNLVPQRIFMGDAGSLFLGFFVAGLSTIGIQPGSRITLSVLIVPVVVMLVPIFDTVLVTAVRVLTGRRISEGGCDHVSHRLVMAGLSERRAVLFLYALAALSGVIATATQGASLSAGLAALSTLGLGMSILGVCLARISIKHYGLSSEAGRLGPMQLPGAGYLRQVANAGINTTLILVSYYAAYAFRHGTEGVLSDPTFVASLPIVLGTKLLALGLFRTYRSVWRYTDSRDLVALAAASTVGSAAAVLVVVFAYEFEGFSRSLFVADWLLFTSLLAGSRLSLRALSEMLRPLPAAATRVLIYGAGDGGVALSQELRRNSNLGRVAVGFIDDDRLKQHTRIQALPVFGGLETLPGALASARIQEVILASAELSEDRIRQVREVCASARIPVTRFDIRVSMDGLEPQTGNVH